MIIDAILPEVYSGQPKTVRRTAPYKDVAENIKHFFARKKQKKFHFINKGV